MLVLGRVSDTSVWPVVKVAEDVPLLATWIVHVQLLPSVVALLTLSVLVAVRSTADVTVTESLKVLLVSLLSTTWLLGSTEALPPLRGLAKAPTPLGVAVKLRVMVPPTGITTLPPLAVAVSSLLLMLPATVPVTPPAVVTVTEP